MLKKTANILLIGCGLHARRVYLPAFKNATNLINSNIFFTLLEFFV